MFIDRLEGKTLKQKQEYCDSMTLPEYINGYVATLCDPRARADIDFMDQFASVNSYIRKNTVMGMTQTHCLPSVDAVDQRVQDLG